MSHHDGAFALTDPQVETNTDMPSLETRRRMYDSKVGFALNSVAVVKAARVLEAAEAEFASREAVYRECLSAARRRIAELEFVPADLEAAMYERLATVSWQEGPEDINVCYAADAARVAAAFVDAGVKP